MKSIQCSRFIWTIFGLYGVATIAFSLTQQSTRQRSSSQFHSTHYLQSTTSETEVKVNVARVSVCTGELCQCQGQEYEYTGGAADAVLQRLQSFDLPFPVDSITCMGACGMGTMIAIDYEGGDSIMTDGLEGAIRELGLQTESLGAKPQTSADSSAVVEDITAESTVLESEVKPAVNTPVKSKSRELTDVRERMREEAAKDDQRENPWMNMASYLAKKAMNSMLGKE